MANKNNKNIKKIIPESTKHHKRKIAIALASILGVTALAGGTAFCLTNEKVRTHLGIGTEIKTETKENQEIKDLKSKVTILEDSVKLLQDEKEKAVKELEEYKAQLDASKELTAEQKSKITELETAVATKEVLITQLQNQQAVYEQQIQDLQNQLAGVTNSVKERLATYEMKNDTSAITNVFRHGNDLFLTTNYSVEIINLTTCEQRLLHSKTSSDKYSFIIINNKLYITSFSVFAEFKSETKELNVLSTSLGDLRDITLKQSINENIHIFINNVSKQQGVLIFSDEEIKVYQVKEDALIIREDGIYFSVSVDKIYKLNKDTLTIDEIINSKYNGMYNTEFLKIINNRMFLSGKIANNKFYSYIIDIENFESNIISTSFCIEHIFEYDSNFYLICDSSTNGRQFYKYEIEQNKSTFIGYIGDGNKSNKAVITNIEFSNKMFISSKSYSYEYDNENKTFVNINLPNNYKELKHINGYLFDITMSYVYNETTGEFQLALSAATTTNKEKYVVIDDTIILTEVAKYFDEETLTFKDFNYETTDYSGCNFKVQNVNDKLFCSYNSNTAAKSGVFYIDLSTKTIKKVTDSGNGDLLNTGYYYQSSLKVNDNTALIYDSGDTTNNYGVLINTDTMEIISVFTGCKKPIVHNGKLYCNYGMYFKVLNIETLQLQTIKSKETLTNLDYSYSVGNMLVYSTQNCGLNVILNTTDNSLEYKYGFGNLDINGLKLGLTNGTYATCLYDPESEDAVLVKGLSTAPEIYETEDAKYYINSTIVYEIKNK